MKQEKENLFSSGISVPENQSLGISSARMEFRMAITVTPTSPKTASHMFARPKAPSSSTANFTASAKATFCRTIPSVFREIRPGISP